MRTSLPRRVAPLSWLLLALSTVATSQRLEAQAAFVRGDANGDGRVSIADADAFDCVLFCDGLSLCPDAEDANDDGIVGVEDFVTIWTELFGDEDPIPAPFPEPGVDPTSGDALRCARETVRETPEGTDAVRGILRAEANAGGIAALPFFLDLDEDVHALQLVLSYDPALFTPLLPDEEHRELWLEGSIAEGPQGLLSDEVLLDARAFPEAGILRVGLLPHAFAPGPGIPAGRSIVALRVVGRVDPSVPDGTILRFEQTVQRSERGEHRTELSTGGVARFPGHTTPARLLVRRPTEFVRGDSNLDGRIDISDAIQALHFLFLGGEMRCRDAADTFDDGANDVSDSIALLLWLFGGLWPPSDPWPACGLDPTVDDLGCAEYPLCASG